jgi:hypothetical protein
VVYDEFTCFVILLQKIETYNTLHKQDLHKTKLQEFT